MRFKIEHEIKGRMRVHMIQQRMSYEEADTLLYYLNKFPFVTSAKVYERTGNVAINYTGSRENVIEALKSFHYEDVEVPAGVIENSGRAMNALYQEKLISKVAFRYLRKWFLPMPLKALWIGAKACGYIAKGAKTLSKGKLEVSVLDATAIGVSMLRGDINTAGSVMFLLGIGELLEEWTHKKSVGDLARSLSLNIEKVWIMSGEQEVLVDVSQVALGDHVVIHMGNVIPFDGVV